MFKLKTFFALLVLMLAFSIVAQAQIDDETDDAPPHETDQSARRPNLLRELGLTDAQIRQLRMINAQSRPRLRDAQEKLRAAKDDLDKAIYADAVDNANIELKLRTFAAAQTEIARIRAQTELAVRNVLTPEQLKRFRELRANFEKRMEEMRDTRQRRQMNRRNRRPDQPPFKPKKP